MAEDKSNSRWELHDSSPFYESQPEPVQQPLPPAPDGCYGWVVTACVAIVNGHSWGINAAYSVFLAHYLANETFSGATHLEYAFVGSLSIGCTFLISPLATICVREFGTRPTMLFGALLQSVSLICASLSTKMWHLFLSQGALFGIGMGLLFLPSYGIIAQWFTKRRALANGVAIAGAGIGGLIYSLGSGAMIRKLGLDWAFRILSIITFVINAACILLIRARYEAIGSRQLAFDTSLLKRVEYLLILAFGSFSMLGYFVLIFTLANYANEIGLDASQAAVIPALLMLGQALGRPVIGYFSDTIGPINMATLMTLLIGVFSLTIWVNAKTYGVLIFFALIEGTVAGAFWVTVAPVMVEVIGLENLPSGLTLLWLTLVLPSTFSEPIALQTVVGTGNYIGAQLFTGLVFIAAAICMGLLRGWKIGQAKGNAEASADTTKRVRYEKHGYTRAFIYDCFKWKNV
ncbi:major facilitator superfamily domain-containing protein [Dactylonectria estremocensis]|uniref:Major facilitator superfamily domain-containing protein n=1 Tax=Dactylonectria estremocensis TaxID=1079267 RepID=A0A9P9ER94_9HYPO|nr:major facilitator superfamily domain-containing protein [Dactylonectria estremocensis]